MDTADVEFSCHDLLEGLNCSWAQGMQREEAVTKPARLGWRRLRAPNPVAVRSVCG